MPLSPIRNLLTSSLKRAGVMRSVDASMIVEAANRALPTYVPANRRDDLVALSYKDGTLRLATKTSAARFALKGQEAELLRKLQVQFPSHPMQRVLYVQQRPTGYAIP